MTKKAFLFGVLLGFGGVLAGAYLYPWAEQPRVASRTSVLKNGGRAERFVIRLPVDRVGSFGGTGLRALDSLAAGKLPTDASGRAPLLEHFKLRDVDGNVIGVAARHWTGTAQGNATAWLLMLPGRGTLMLAGSGEPAEAVDAALNDRGYVSGRPWQGELTLQLSSGETPAPAAGSEEFAGLQVSYTETWSVTGVGSRGELRGTITIDTASRRGT